MTIIHFHSFVLEGEPDLAMDIDGGIAGNFEFTCLDEFTCLC